MSNDIRKRMLAVIAATDPHNIQSRVIIKAVLRETEHTLEMEQAVLACWHDLMRTGVLAWGYNASNPDPPFAHLTEHGRRLLKSLSRDPANPEGYLASLGSILAANPVARSYVMEALGTFNAGFHKSAAVMIGAAGESLVLELRDKVVAQLRAANEQLVKSLDDWRIKRVLDALETIFEARVNRMPQGLRERLTSYWSGFSSHLRLARNDSGHPKNVEPVTLDVVHGSLLIFPELAKLISELAAWVDSEAF